MIIVVCTGIVFMVAAILVILCGPWVMLTWTIVTGDKKYLERDLLDAAPCDTGELLQKPEESCDAKPRIRVRWRGVARARRYSNLNS